MYTYSFKFSLCRHDILSIARSNDKILLQRLYFSHANVSHIWKFCRVARWIFFIREKASCTWWNLSTTRQHDTTTLRFILIFTFCMSYHCPFHMAAYYSAARSPRISLYRLWQLPKVASLYIRNMEKSQMNRRMIELITSKFP